MTIMMVYLQKMTATTKMVQIGPDFPEIYYNGIDENCDGKDDFDQDGDGFVTDEYIGKITQGVPNSGQFAGRGL